MDWNTRSYSLARHAAVWLAMCCLALAAGTSRAASVTASVDHPVVTLGESVTLTILIDGAQTQQPALPPIDGFSAGGTGVGLNLINGAVQQTFTYELTPTRAGVLVIPAMQLNIGGQAARTQPITVRVLNPGEAAGGGLPAQFAKIVLQKTNLYVGEVIDAEIQVYFQDGAIRQYPQIPNDPGFTLGKWLNPTQTRVALSNRAYNLVSFKAPLTAVKAGALDVGPVTQPIRVMDRSRQSFFGFGTEREIRALGDKVRAIALPLQSQNVPPTFAGAVGQYTVTMTAAPTNVAVGDPITVKVRIAGHGWLDALTAPPQPQWRDFKTYAPNGHIEGSDANNVNGTKIFEIAAVPQNPAITQLPPYAFSFFDPDAGAYRTVAAPAIPLTVTASTAPVTALPRLTATNQNTPAPMSDIAHIKVRLGTVATDAPIVRQPWFLGLQLVAPALWLGLLARRKMVESAARNPRLRRRREVQNFVRDALAQLRTYAAEKKSDEFFATLFRALQEQIAERLDVPSNSVTEAIIDERLRPGGLADATCGTLHELFQAANLARYAPVKSSQELNALLPKVEQALRELQQWEAAP